MPTLPENLPLEIDVRSVKQLLDNGDSFQFIDCREQDEYDLVKLAQTKLLPVSEVITRAGELENCRGDRIVIHCHHGGRSLQFAQWLRSQGFPHAQSMAGGIDAWAVEIDTSLRRY